jgi:hypothetical protein
VVISDLWHHRALAFLAKQSKDSQKRGFGAFSKAPMGFKPQSPTSAAIFRSSNLPLTPKLDFGDVFWDLQRFVRGSLFDVQRVAMQVSIFDHSPPTRKLRVWRLDAVAFACTCMHGMYGMTQACASILRYIAQPQAAVDFADLSLAFVHLSLFPPSLSFIISLANRIRSYSTSSLRRQSKMPSAADIVSRSKPLVPAFI